MELNYIYAESTVNPETLEIEGNTVYLRKSLTEAKRTDEQGDTTTYWTYHEAKLTLGEFNEYANALLVSGQKMGDENLLTVMEAIADFYDVLALLMM